ncbi:geranylgeranyl transferase type-1 subunit beta [Cylas formicarius]|uniref:geranylgeranyl transferase type-1 subunit beta n=1 Tax=Cylas formicarius TaxID=197179 RepID=UPI00295832F5|nr:geranylgeranyl transferase type-1 subunit beta [Cylas formicarius]
MCDIPSYKFKPELHKKYLSRFLNHRLPSFFASMDTNRSVIIYFCLAGLDVLGNIDKLSRKKQNEIIECIYSLQVVNENELVSGFQGSSFLNTKDNRSQPSPYKWCHIANTYSCLLSLLILGDDLSRVNKEEIIKSLRVLQLRNGSFKGAIEGAESDMRFVYCAACISYILNDWRGIDIEKMMQFILNSISYDGGIGQGPELESHCGSTFCAVASLALSNNLHRLSKRQFHNLRRWLLMRLETGFNGRPNKPTDTCYSFWTGGALKILNAYQFIEADDNPQFILMTQDKYGGFAKWMNAVPDPMHTYFGLAGLSLMKFDNLREMFCPLNCTRKVHDHLKTLHAGWS